MGKVSQKSPKDYDIFILPGHVYLSGDEIGYLFAGEYTMDELINKKIIELTDQDKVVIDPDFTKSLLRIINHFEKKSNKNK